MYVKELGLFVTVKILEDTPAMLPPWQTLRRTRILLREDQWSTFTCHEKWQKDTMQHGKLRADRCARVVNWLDYKYIFNIVFAGLGRF